MRTVPLWLTLALVALVGAGSSAATIIVSEVLGSSFSLSSGLIDRTDKIREICELWHGNPAGAVNEAAVLLREDESYRPFVEKVALAYGEGTDGPNRYVVDVERAAITGERAIH
ncbi:hypothetical protein [Cryptosporangium japonicum]|uniref:Uncharacterized protein n=1 Tax=Cryptosporangium japonicum TaxID=80872 RepID=A0ABP3ES82_9ACTN